jgi:hypothetical protein
MSEIEPNAAGPEPKDDEKDASTVRRREEEAQRGPGSDNPDSGESESEAKE